MNKTEDLRPIFRSDFRVFLGTRYYISKRYLEWIFVKKRYAKQNRSITLENIHMQHKTPLYRQLKDVDMSLQENKVENLKIALKHIDGIVIKPGETFSYWKSLGNPTAIKGYKKGMVLYYGKFKSATGGGLCQLSNLIYWMSLHTPLTVTERHRHSFDVFPDSNRVLPFGSGATCVYNYRDLQITNNTKEDYQLNIKIEDDYLVGEISSNVEQYLKYNVYEEGHKISHEYWGGYVRHNLINREIVDMNDKFVANEYVCENHALMMYEPMLGSVED